MFVNWIECQVEGRMDTFNIFILYICVVGADFALSSSNNLEAELSQSMVISTSK